MTQRFHGAKAAVFIGEQVLLYRRDEDVRWGNMWDMPGGGRECDETPRECLKRELFEEFGLALEDAAELWAQRFPAMLETGEAAWFFGVQFPVNAVSTIRFGEEGQYWRLFPLSDALALPDLIDPLRQRLEHMLPQVDNWGG